MQPDVIVVHRGLCLGRFLRPDQAITRYRQLRRHDMMRRQVKQTLEEQRLNVAPPETTDQEDFKCESLSWWPPPSWGHWRSRPSHHRRKLNKINGAPSSRE